MDILKLVWDLLRGRNPEDAAKISAYLLAPGLVLIMTISGVHGRPLAIGWEKPITITDLRTELAGNGDVRSKKGVALIVEPVESEYRIPLEGGSSTIWSSLDEQTIRANRDRLALDQGGLKGKTPFLGTSDPVAIVIEGDLGGDIQIPGGTERLEEWRLPSRRSVSIVASVMLACVFAFGISLATGLPSARGDEDAAG
jgi:hypothetical protein